MNTEEFTVCCCLLVCSLLLHVPFRLVYLKSIPGLGDSLLYHCLNCEINTIGQYCKSPCVCLCVKRYNNNFTRKAVPAETAWARSKHTQIMMYNTVEQWFSTFLHQVPPQKISKYHQSLSKLASQNQTNRFSPFPLRFTGFVMPWQAGDGYEAISKYHHNVIIQGERLL